MTDARYKTIYIPQELHQVLKAHCDKHHMGKIGKFSHDAIVNALLDDGLARRWDGDGWVWYEVDNDIVSAESVEKEV